MTDNPQGPTSAGKPPQRNVTGGLGHKHDEPETLAEEADPAHALGSRSAQRLPRLLLVLAGLAFAWVAIQGMRGLQDIIAPLFLAVTLVIAAYPLKRLTDRRGAPTWVGAGVVALVVLAVLIAFFWAMWWAIAALVKELPLYSDKFTDLYHGGLQWLSRFGIDDAQLAEWTKDFKPSSLFGAVQSAAGSVSGFLGLLVTIVLVLFFATSDVSSIHERHGVVRSQHPGLVAALEDFAVGVRRYWVVSTVFGLIVALLDLGALLILGVPLALVWAVLAFVTNYVPNIGFVIGIIPPALMALLAKGPWAALTVVIVYSVLNFVVQSLIQPKFTGDAVGVTPLVSFLSLLVWAFVLGPLGALLALPATLFVKALFVDADPETRWLNAYIAAKPKTGERYKLPTSPVAHVLRRPRRGPDPEPEPAPPEPPASS